MSDNIISSLKCPVCNSESEPYKKLQEVDLYRCNNCSHCFTDTNTIIDNETYSNDYFEEKHHLNHFSWKSLGHLFENKPMLNLLEHDRTPDNIDAVDLPEANFLIKKLYKLSLVILFLFGRLLNKPLLQTLIMKKVIN